MRSEAGWNDWRSAVVALWLGAATIVATFAAHAEAPAQCALSTRTAQVGAGTIVWNTVGTGSPVLLVHGLFANKEQWSDLACRLADAGFAVLAPDLPGYGKSEGYGVGDYRLEAQVTLLREWLTGLAVERVDVAGNSMGGTIATMYATRYPRQVRTLAFVGSPLGIVAFNEPIAEALYEGVNPFIPVDVPQLDLELSLLFVTPPQIPLSTKDAVVANYVANNLHYVQVWNIVNLYIDVLRERPITRHPALIVWGKDDRVFDVAGALLLQRRLPGSELHRLRDAGHLLHVENAAEVAPIYVNFLRKRRP